MQKIVQVAAVFIILSAASAVRAQERGYVGLTIGPSKAGVMNGVGQRIDHDNDVIAFKVYAGYALSEHFAIEGGYAGTNNKPRFDRRMFGVAALPTQRPISNGHSP